jgi:phosphoribosyl 1,2-cyclic phosphodiesterase
LLIDCGPLTYTRLREHAKIGDITQILLTHLHGDHVGGLFQLVLYMNGRLTPKRKPVIIYPTEWFRDHIEAFLTFWFPRPRELVEFAPITQFQGLGALDTTNKHMQGLPSFAYFFVDGDSLIYFSGDIGDVRVAADFLATRKETNITVFHEIHHLTGAAHVHYRDVMENLSGYRVYGYHCDPRKIPSDNVIPLVANTPDLLFPR